MGIYIPNIEMPKACVYRENGYLITCLLYDADGYCGALNTEANHKEGVVYPGCPLKEVPSHGRLIDADKLNVYDISPVYGFSVMGVTEEDIIQAPTIIPASEEGE